MKKGFTLIELLAVIVILAIIALIALPILINIISDVKKGSIEVTMNNIDKAASLYYQGKQNPTEEIFTCDKGKCKSNLNNTLKVNGKLPDSGTITISEKGLITYTSIKIDGYFCDKLGNSFSCRKASENVVTSTNKITTITNNKTNNLINYRIYGNSITETYQRVEYIQNEGAQYIDTGILANENNSFETQAQLIHTNTTSQTIWGGRNSNVANSLQGNQLSFVKSTSNYQFISGNINIATKTSDTNLHTFYAKKNKLYIDNELIYEVESAPITSKNNIYLFSTNTAGELGFNGGSLKMYYFKIQNNDILLRNYIPCYRKSDGVVGLYDLVGNKFYTNKGTGTFIKGNDINQTLIEYQSVGNYDITSGKYKIPVKVYGKNLFKIKSADKKGQSAYYGYGETRYGLNDDGYTLYSYTGIGFDYNNLNIGEKYTLSLKFNNTLESGRFMHIGQNMYKNNTEVLNAKAFSINVTNEKYLSLKFTADKTNLLAFSLQNGEGSLNITDIQLEVGDTRTNYEPYKEEIVNIYIDEPLRKIGNYVDYLDFSSKKIIREVGKLTLTGEENWNVLDNVFYTSIGSNYKDEALSLSTHFKYNDNFWIENNKLYIKMDNIMSLENFKSWLKEQSVSIYYPLKNSKVDKIDCPNIKLNNNYNNIMVDTSILPSKIELEYN